MGNDQSVEGGSSHQPKEIFVQLLTNESANKTADVIIAFVDTSWNHEDEILGGLRKLGGNKFSSEWSKLKQNKANNCQIGDVFLVEPGSLPCRHVLFAVWREGHGTEATDVQVNFIVNNMLERAKSLEDDIHNIAIPLGCGMNMETHVKIMNNVFLWLMAFSSETVTHLHFLASNSSVEDILKNTLQGFKDFTQHNMVEETQGEEESTSQSNDSETSEDDTLPEEDAPQNKKRYVPRNVAAVTNGQTRTIVNERLGDSFSNLRDSRMSSESSEEGIPYKKLVDKFPEKESIWKYYTGSRDIFDSIRVRKRPRSVHIDEEALEYDFHSGRPVRRTLSQSSVDEVKLDHLNFEPKRKVRRSRRRRSAVPENQIEEENFESFFCSICQSKKRESSKRVLQKCGHEFCSDCINRYFKEVKPRCPNCNEFYGIPLGNQPYGVMSYRIINQYLAGFPGTDTIVIEYDIPDGTQTEKHPNPGVKFKGAHRIAFLPSSDKGKKVHRLLQKAFDQKLIFTVGRSVTTGKENVVTWNDIHHKTRADGGPERYGYPDPEYLDRVLGQLEKAGITDSDED